MDWERPRFERPQRPGDEPPREGKRRRFNPLLIFAIALFGVGAFYVLLVVATLADDIFFPGNELKIGVKLPGVDSGSAPDEVGIEDRINIVLLGLDRRIGAPGDQPARTDSVAIITVDPFSKTAGVFSIPRDLLVEIPDGNGGYTVDRINVAWQMGEFIYDRYPGGGPGIVKDTIKHNFDIPIDNYVILDWADFKNLIDELGGIEVDVPEYVADYNYSDCVGCPGYAVEFLPGPEHMDGSRALAYVRIRKGSNDFKRMERQQQVMRATFEKALSTNLLVPPTRALDMYNKFKDAVDTDISSLRVPGLAALATQIDSNSITMVSLASATYPCAECPGAVLYADWEEIEELKAQVFGDGRIQAEGALVELQNGTEQPGLADQIAVFLRRQGIAADSLLLSDASSVYSRSLIVNLSGKEYTAKKLAEWLNLPGDRIVTSDDPEFASFSGATGDIVVVLGPDAHPATAVLPSAQ